MEALKQFSQLIEALYDAASGNASFWPIAPRIAAAFASASCTLFVRDGFAGPIEELTVTANHTPEQRARYEAYYYQHDIWANLGMAFPKGTIMTGDEVISDDAFRDSPIYRDHARHAGCFHVLGALVPIGGGRRARSACSACIGARPKAASTRAKRNAARSSCRI